MAKKFNSSKVQGFRGLCRGILTVFITLMFAFVPCVFAAGGESFAFLKLGMGTRATGMGCAFTSIADDASAPYFNPAGTVNLKGFELMGETYFLSFGRSLNYVATAKPFVIAGTTYAAGFSWINNSSGSDIETRLTNSPEPDARISDSSHIFLFNVAGKVSDAVSLGGNFRFVFENLGTFRGTGVGFDLGAMANITGKLNAGISITGISTNITWNTGTHTETLPQVVVFGVSNSFERLFGAPGMAILPSVDIVYNTFSGFRARAGAEFSLDNFLFIRAGYNNGFSFGFGIRPRPSQIFTVKIDYALTVDSIVPGALNHRAGATIVYVFPETGVAHKNPPDAGQPNNRAAPEEKGSNKKAVEDYDW